MGVAYYPVFERLAAEWPDDIDGKCLAKESESLDMACKAAGIPCLIDFFSATREMMICEMLGGDPEDPSTYDESLLPEEVWFDATAGLQTVDFLIEHLETGRGTVDQRDSVLNDLKAFRGHLAAARDNGVRWHLSMDY